MLRKKEVSKLSPGKACEAAQAWVMEWNTVQHDYQDAADRDMIPDVDKKDGEIFWKNLSQRYKHKARDV